MNKKILLVQPTYPTSPFSGSYLPVGLGYLAEQLFEAGIDYEIVDMSFNDFSFLKAKIVSFEPDFIGISLMSLDIDHHYELISKIKKQFPSIKIIAGGPHISFVKEEALKDRPAIDFGIVHEGDESLIELIQLSDPVGIKGVIYRTDKEIIYNGDRDFIQILDDYHFPTYKKFDLPKYGKKIDIISSRGCPFNCIFCGAHLSMGREWRSRSPESIVEEIEFWYKVGYIDFNFVDSNFFFNKHRCIELCDKLKIKGLNITISSDGMRADSADIEMLQKMRKFGLKSVAIGVESADETILKNIKKGESLSQIENAIKVCIKLNINVILFFIIGLPGETKKSVEKSFELALKYPVCNAYFFNVNPLPKTELYKWAEKNNYLLTSKEDMFKNIGGMGEIPLIATPELSYDERKKLYKKGLLISKKVRRNFNRKNRIKILYKDVKNGVTASLSSLKFISNNQEKFANQIFTHLTVKEKTLLKHYATKVPKDGIILEVGSYLGSSACFLALGAKKLGQRIYCIDTWHNEGMTEGQRDTFSEFRKNTEKFNNIIPLRGKSKDIGKNFNEKIDLLFIDGEHSYEAVKTDLNVWLPHTKNGTILIMHDYGWAEGVIRSVDEIVKPIEIKKDKSIENMYITQINGELFK